MNTKKHPRADVRRNSSVYFAVGLALMLLTANYAINYRTYEKAPIDLATLALGTIDDNVIPITKQIKTPPPVKQQPKVPDEIKVIDDEKDLEESVIDTSEDAIDDPIIDIADVVVDDLEENVEVPFAFIEDVPEFPGCDKGDNEAKKNCMAQKISKHVQKKFNQDLAADLGLTGKQRISVMFKIDKTGNIVGVQSRAPHPKLEQEATRVINLLPKMKPGKQRGEAVTVSYALPIVFKVEN